jgi:small subunit ribosomal protein S8
MDPIADLLTNIRNAGSARHATTTVPYSRLKERVVEILRDEGYLESFAIEKGEGVHRNISINLRYIDGIKLAIKEIKRISKQGCRVYCTAKNIPKVKAGLGTAIISTSKGIMTDRNARRLNVGGEILCEIW